MKYIQTKFCRGSFIIEKQIDLDNFLNKDEQKRFYNLRQAGESNMSEEDFNWYEDVLNRIQEESDCISNINAKVVDYDIDDWAEYEDENWVI